MINDKDLKVTVMEEKVIASSKLLSEPLIANKNIITPTVKTKRSSQYELLRFLAAFFVLAFHCLGSKYTWTWSVFNIFLVVPVPLFIIISGFFLANTKKAKILKYLWMLLIVYLLNIFISYFFFKYNLIHENAQYRVTWQWVLSFGWGPWWYFWTIPILYLLAPFLNYGLKAINKWYSLTFIVILYVIWFFTMNIIYYPQRLVGAGQIVFFVAIYMLGAWWKLYGTQLNTKNLALKIAIITLATIEIINLILFATLKITLFTMGQDWIVGGYDSVGQTNATFAGKDTAQPFTVISALAIFIVFQNLKLNYHWFLNFLGRLSIPIFLYHFAFMNVVNDTITPKIFSNINNPEAVGVLATLLIAGMTITFSAIVIVPIDYLVDKGVWLTNYLINKTKGRFLKIKKINPDKTPTTNNETENYQK
jgi:surface polysaccharide O-acyltransferase-like enzyme